MPVPHITNGDRPPYTLETPLEDLLAVYGDSSASNWNDQQYKVFRDHTGGAIGFVESRKHAVVWGSPCCVPEDETIRDLVRNFVEWCKGENLEPIFACVNEQTQRVLVNSPFRYHSITSTVEQYVDIELAMQGGSTGAKRGERAQRVDTEVVTYEHSIDETERKGVEDGLAAWQDARSKKGKQVHTSSLTPFRDPEHRIYFVARHPTGGDSQGILVLTEMLDGYYVKWNISFKRAPSGTSELLASTAIEWASEHGAKLFTFGQGAAEELDVGEEGERINSWKEAILKKTYASIHSTFDLHNKTSFRRKFPLAERAGYIAWPPGAMGVSATRGIFKVFQE